MDKETLLAFIQRILEKGSASKSELALRQLQAILTMQNAHPVLLELIRTTLEGMPEVKAAVREAPVTEEALRIARQRAQARRAREAADAMRGRC